MAAAVAVAADGGRGDAVGARGGGAEVGLVHADAADLEDLLERAPGEALRQRLVGLLAGRGLRGLGARDEVHAVIDHRVGLAPILLLVAVGQLQLLQVVLLEGPLHLLVRRLGADDPDQFVGGELLDVRLQPLALGVVAEVAVALQRVDREALMLRVAGAGEGELLVEDQRGRHLQVRVLPLELLGVVGVQAGPHAQRVAQVVLGLEVGEEELEALGVGQQGDEERLDLLVGHELPQRGRRHLAHELRLRHADREVLVFPEVVEAAGPVGRRRGGQRRVEPVAETVVMAFPLAVVDAGLGVGQQGRAAFRVAARDGIERVGARGQGGQFLLHRRRHRGGGTRRLDRRLDGGSGAGGGPGYGLGDRGGRGLAAEEAGHVVDQARGAVRSREFPRVEGAIVDRVAEPGRGHEHRQEDADEDGFALAAVGRRLLRRQGFGFERRAHV
ncbi:MAG: hypothetical protein RL304_282 [Verrucomicrobiota bacterium]